MQLFETTVIYLLVGLTVAAAMAITGPGRSLASAGAHFLFHTVAWPFFAPLLLGRAIEEKPRSRAPSGPTKPRINGSPPGRIDKIEARLVDALQRLGPVAEEVLGPKLESVHDLSRSLHRMEARQAEMDALLESDEFDRHSAEQALQRLLDDPDVADDDPRLDSLRSRLRNIDRLHRMSHRTRRDLQQALLKMEEMNSQILLLQFAEQRSEQIADHIQEIASTIEGLSESLLTV